MYIPYHIVHAHILPHLGIDVRLAFGVPPKPLEVHHIEELNHHVHTKLRATTHSMFVTWCRIPIRGTNKAFVFRAHDGSRGCDLVDFARKTTTTLWDTN